MKFFLDSTSLTEIQEVAHLGLLDGVVMNASVHLEEGLNFHERLQLISKSMQGPISVGVLNIEENAMVKEGQQLAKIGENIIVKCPMTPSGLRATKRLTAVGIHVNVSLCFTVGQAFVAAKAGAWCVSLGLDQTMDSQCFMKSHLHSIVRVFRNHEVSTHVLLAGVETSQELLDSALVGSHICTMRFPVFQQLVGSPVFS